jgi:YHS domain-containing protein
MLTLLVRILLVAALVIVVSRVVRGLAEARRRPVQPPRQATMVRDPVCGMYLDATLALRVARGGEALYFCSDDCRRKFLAAGS